MKKLIIGFAVLYLIGLILLPYTKHQKAYQIIITPEKEYYTNYYNVDLETGCITFYSFNNCIDSSYVKVCKPWDVKPNPDYKP